MSTHKISKNDIKSAHKSLLKALAVGASFFLTSPPLLGMELSSDEDEAFSATAHPCPPEGMDGTSKQKREARARNDAETLLYLGKSALLGQGVEKNEKKAIEFFSSLLDLSDVSSDLTSNAQYYLAKTYLRLADQPAATHWCKEAADLGHEKARFLLAKIYETGSERDYDGALVYYQLAADMNHPQALGRIKQLKDKARQFSIGEAYAKGTQTALYDVKAVQGYKKAAAQGHVDACCHLGAFHESERGGLKKDVAEAKRLYSLAAAAGHEGAQQALARLQKIEEDEKQAALLLAIEEKFKNARALVKDQQYEQAYQAFLPLARQGHAEADYNLGLLCEQGQGVVRDYDEALKYHSKAAAQKYKKALRRAEEFNQADFQYMVGKSYYEGIGTPLDKTKAIKWYERAAAQGHHEALYKLGKIFAGQGPFSDLKKALDYLTRASNSGFPKASLYLGDCYETGYLVKRSLARAEELYHLAEKQGMGEAAQGALLRLREEEKRKKAVERAMAARIAAERAAAEAAERERVAAQRAEADRIAAQRAEIARIAAKRAATERERVAAVERAEIARIAAERAAAERVAEDEREQIAAQRAEVDRIAAERAAAAERLYFDSPAISDKARSLEKVALSVGKLISPDQHLQGIRELFGEDYTPLHFFDWRGDGYWTWGKVVWLWETKRDSKYKASEYNLGAFFNRLSRFYAPADKEKVLDFHINLVQRITDTLLTFNKDENGDFYQKISIDRKRTDNIRIFASHLNMLAMLKGESSYDVIPSEPSDGPGWCCAGPSPESLGDNMQSKFDAYSRWFSPGRGNKARKLLKHYNLPIPRGRDWGKLGD